jgi:uncharacterized protein YqfB (UPF0267 family)
MKLMETLYEQLAKDYEQKFSQMSITPEGVRYLKIRSLVDVEPLKASRKLKNFLCISERKVNLDEIRKKLFLDNNFSNEKLNELLREVYLELRSFRKIDFNKVKSSVSKIAEEGEEYWNAWNSVYRDNIRQYIQHHFVRNVEIQSYEELLRNIDNKLDPIIKGYVIISWYNQWCSTVIEDFIFTHPKVIPTARRIDKVDFFFLDIPFDLKITFIPRGYIKQNLRRGIISKEEDIIEEIRKAPENLIKWFYEEQGEARFSDSHRMFIVLADKSNLEKSWKLKAKFDTIQEKINSFLNSCNSINELKMVEWEFKDKKIKGKYKTYSYVILIEG